MKKLTIPLLGGMMLAASAFAAVAYDEKTIALIETRSCSVADRTRGWIETRLGDTDTGLTTIDTAKPFGLRISFR